MKDFFETPTPSYTFEIFPPKGSKSLEGTFAAIDGLASLGPDLISVTYGAGGTSRDLARLLAVSTECFLLAVTLGPEVDRRIFAAQQRDMLEGMTLDACASVRADVLCDETESEIAAGLDEGQRLTMRFSPGSSRSAQGGDIFSVRRHRQRQWT